MASTRLARLLAAGMLWASCGALAAQPGADDRLQRLRSESFRMVSGVLLGYDALAGTLEPRDDRRAGLARLDAALAALRGEVAAFAGALRELQGLEDGVAPMRINQLLDTQARLVEAAGALHVPAAGGALKQRLHELSLVSGRVLILHQLRPGGGLLVYPGLPLNEELLANLDRQVEQGLHDLHGEAALAQREVGVLLRNYRFIRPRLFEARKALAGHAVDHYLGQNTRLDELAGAL